MWILFKKGWGWGVELIEKSVERVARGWGGRNRERLVKRYKLPVTRRIRSEDLTYNMMIIVDNTVLYN